nr:MAG TPA: hypothetical protein [Caudoviricetes sp.]
MVGILKELRELHYMMTNIILICKSIAVWMKVIFVN